MGKREQKKNALTDELERVKENDTIIHKADLKEAAKYHINLDELEGFENILEGVNDGQYEEEQQKETLQQDSPKPTEKAVSEGIHLNIEDAYVPLNDMARKIFRRALRPVVIISDDKIAYANPSFLKILGKESAYEVVGKSFWEYVMPEYWESPPPPGCTGAEYSTLHQR